MFLKYFITKCKRVETFNPLMGYSVRGLALVAVTLCLQRAVLAKEPKCGFPGAPAYGWVKPDNAEYYEGDTVTYICRVGYILLGSPINRCTDDGSWSEDVPICDDSMTTLGVAFSTPTVPGHSAEMAIDRDKDTCTYLKPKKPRWWRINLGGQYVILSVAITMISTDKPVKFTVYITQIQGTGAFYKRCAAFSGKFGTQTVVLACAEGKGIEGEIVHIEDHNQTGLFEICEVEVQVEKDTSYDCGRPSRKLYSVTFEPEEGRVTYQCIMGYELKGKNYRVCRNTGQWSGDPPVCEPIICDELEPLENGQTSLSVGENTTPLEGAVAIYQCDRGYKLIGTFTRNCQRDGSWSGKAPTCKAIRCPIPDGRSLGGVYRLMNSSNSVGSMAVLKCKRGIKRDGNNPYITCTEEGEWTEPEAQCVWPSGTAFKKQEKPRIVNQEAIIFGMVVAAIMIVVVLVALYLYTQKRRNSEKPEVPSRFSEPPVPPPRPPPRAKGGTFKSAIMGLIARENAVPDKEDPNAWKTQSLPSDHGLCNDVESQNHPKKAFSYDEVHPGKTREDNPAVIQVEVLNEDESRLKGPSSPPRQKAAGDYAAVDYEKKRQSRLMKEQDSVDSASTGGRSPIPPEEVEKESRSPTPPKHLNRSETEESEASNPPAAATEARPKSPEGKPTRTRTRKAKEEEEKAKREEERKAKEEEEKKAKEEEEKKAKEEEERKAKEEEEKKAKEEEERKAKEEAEKKEKEEAEKKEKQEAAAPGSRRRRVRAEEPPPEPEEKPVLRRTRRFQ